MMKKTAWVFLLALVFAVLFSASKAFGQLSQMTYSAGVKSFKNYVKNPDCAKNVLNITASGGSFAKGTTTPLNLDTVSECTIDASSSGQTYTWALSTLGQDLKGKNCEARFVFEGDASLYKAYVKNGSSQITADLQLTYPTYSRDVSINVPCGDLSASNTVVIESTSASAAAISVAQVYFGEATDLSNVAQAKFFGSIKYAAAASCQWVRTNTSLGNFSADTDCATGTLSGNAVDPGSKIPAIKFSSMPPGDYYFIASGGFSGTAGAAISNRFSDGTNNTNINLMYAGAGTPSVNTVSGRLTYTTTQSNVTINIQGAASSNDANIGNTTAELEIMVYYFPSSSEIAVRQNNSPWYVAAYLDGANSSLGTLSVSSYTEISDAGLTLTPQTGSQPVGVMCSGTNAATAPTTSTSTCAAGSESVGINFNIPEAGSYEACWSSGWYIATASGVSTTATFQLVETPTNAQTLTLEGGNRQSLFSIGTAAATAEQFGVGNCSIFNWTSSGTKGIRVMYEQLVASGNPSSSLLVGDNSATQGQRNIYFTVKPVTRRTPMSLLVGSVTSNTSGMERVERATTSNTNCSTFSSQSGTWIAYTSNPATGNCNFALTGFTARPTCHITAYSNGAGDVVCHTKSGTTSTNLETQCTVDGVATAALMEIICMGPR